MCIILSVYYIIRPRVLSAHKDGLENLILGPSPTAKTRPLFFNRRQSRTVIGLLAGHNTLWRYLYIIGLIDSPICKRCGAEEETSAHGLSECEAVVSLRHTHLSSFYFDPEDFRSISLGAIWNFSWEVGSPFSVSNYGVQRNCLKGLSVSVPKGLEPIYYSNVIYILSGIRKVNVCFLTTV